MPVLGLGVYLAQNGGEAEQAVLWALQQGYRLIDTAKIYENEEDVGKAVRGSGIPRDQIFVTTKLATSDHGKENTIQACQESLRKLGLDYVDLYLIHSPSGGKILETWGAMIELKKRGLAKSIGVSNFNVHHLKPLKEAYPDYIPAVNQIELSPYLTFDEVVAYCQKEHIALEAYCPLAKGFKLEDPLLLSIAAKYKKSAAQLLIRWSIQRGFVCIPKSARKDKIIENSNVFDFEISAEDMTTLNGLNENFITDWEVIFSPWSP
eukprot:Em0551g5a